MSKQALNQLAEEVNQLSKETPGQRIRKLRKDLGLKQKELATLLGFTANYLGQVERDARPLSKNMAELICGYFHVDYNYLYHGIQSDPLVEHDRLQENPVYDCDFRTLLNNYIQSCSEDECRRLEPIIRSLIQSIRETGWFDPQETGQIEDES